jgi:glutaredoxin-like YruB-family protein
MPMANVKVYSTPTCPYCVRVKKYLSEKGVVFENIDVAGNETALKEMVDVSGQMGVPVIVIDGEVIVGFDQSRIDKKLGNS